MMISVGNVILAIFIIVFIDVVQSVTINFDSNAVALELEEMIIKRPRLNCDDREAVNLSGNNLKKIPKGFIKSTAIRSIILNDNEIDDIPDGVFDDVPNLQCLDLTYNRIPASKLLNFKHDSLNALILDHQVIMESVFNNNDISLNDITLNTSKVNFPNLKILSLKGVNYNQFSLYSNLFPKLSTIYLENSDMRYINPDITDYFSPYLKSIHFERNNFNHVVITNLRNVEELYFDENPLEKLVIEQDPNLKVLSLANCNLGMDWHLVLSNIVTLDLKGNLMTEIIIDEKLSTYDTLDIENLSLSHNRFKNIPDLGSLPRLQKLSLSYNLIETIDRVINANSLITLHLKGNQINTIQSTAFSACPMLEELDLSENQLASLPHNWAQNLTRLRYLNLQSNAFKNILDTSIYPLSNLNDLYVGNNHFRTIDDHEMKYLPNNCTVYVM